MATLPSNSTALRRMMCGLALAFLAAAPARAQYNPDWARNFRVGVMAGFNIKTEFRSSGNFNVGGNQPPGTFDDGFVRQDSTGSDDGRTIFFGYQTDSQISGNTITYRDTTSFDTGGGSASESGAFVGFDLAYGGVIWNPGRYRVGWEFGFGLMPISMTAKRSGSASVNQDILEFDTEGSQLFPAPYSGPRNFGPGESFPTIIATPTSLTPTNLPGTVDSSQTLQVTLYALRLGPNIFLDLTPEFGLAFSAGPALGIVSGELRFNDKITTDTTVNNKGSFGSTEIVYGGYVNATLTYHAVANGDIYVTAQYMPLGTASFNGGNREARLKLNGAVYFSAGVNWPF